MPVACFGTGKGRWLLRDKEWYRRVYAFNQYNRDRWVAAQAALIPRGCTVLDVGAGPAPYRSTFSHCLYKAHDFAQEPSTIGKYTKLDYVSDITNIPVPSNSFDVILCTEVLEHVPEPIQAIKEFARILNSRGILLVTAPLGSLLHQEPYHFYGGYTPYWYKKVLSEAGFLEIAIETNGGFFSFFAQEALRFSALLDPRRTWRFGWRYIPLGILWLVTLPFLRIIFPWTASSLDALGIDRSATVGYHIVAKKEAAVSESSHGRGRAKVGFALDVDGPSQP